jgi:hypothetical protein
MQNVAPNDPVALSKVAVTSKRVTNYSFDQLDTAPAFDQIALEP